MVKNITFKIKCTVYHYFFVIDSVITRLLLDKCTLNIIVHCWSYYSTSGNECLTMYGVPHSSAWDLWSNEVALLILTVVFLSLTYIQLRRTSLLKWEQLPRLEWPLLSRVHLACILTYLEWLSFRTSLKQLCSATRSTSSQNCEVRQRISNRSIPWTKLCRNSNWPYIAKS